MNKSYLTIALTLASLCGSAISARAQDSEGILVKVPFEFVVGAKTMPAGTYNIGRIRSDASSGLIISSRDNSAIVLPLFVGAAAEEARLSFEHVGDQYVLSHVETPAGAYAIKVPQRMTTLAQQKKDGAVSFSGGN